MKTVAFLRKHSIHVTDAHLETKYTINVERGGHVKSAAWDEKGVLFYNTLTHISYRCPNGDSGTIPLDFPLYITKVSAGGRIYCLDRNADIKLLHAKDDLGYDSCDLWVTEADDVEPGAGDVAGDVEEVDVDDAVADMNEELDNSQPIWDQYEDDLV